MTYRPRAPRGSIARCKRRRVRRCKTTGRRAVKGAAIRECEAPLGWAIHPAHAQRLGGGRVRDAIDSALRALAAYPWAHAHRAGRSRASGARPRGSARTLVGPRPGQSCNRRHSLPRRVLRRRKRLRAAADPGPRRGVGRRLLPHGRARRSAVQRLVHVRHVRGMFSGQVHSARRGCVQVTEPDELDLVARQRDDHARRRVRAGAYERRGARALASSPGDGSQKAQRRLLHIGRATLKQARGFERLRAADPRRLRAALPPALARPSPERAPSIATDRACRSPQCRYSLARASRARQPARELGRAPRASLDCAGERRDRERRGCMRRDERPIRLTYNPIVLSWSARNRGSTWSAQGLCTIQKDPSGRLLRAVQAIAISADDAKELVRRLHAQSEKQHPGSTSAEHQERVANHIVRGTRSWPRPSVASPHWPAWFRVSEPPRRC